MIPNVFPTVEDMVFMRGVRLYLQGRGFKIDPMNSAAIGRTLRIRPLLDKPAISHGNIGYEEESPPPTSHTTVRTVPYTAVHEVH